jgi:hypothetical protein
MNLNHVAVVALIALTAGYPASAQQIVTAGASAVDASARATASRDTVPAADAVPDHSNDLYQSEARRSDGTGQSWSPADPIQGALNPTTEPLISDRPADSRE